MAATLAHKVGRYKLIDEGDLRLLPAADNSDLNFR